MPGKPRRDVTFESILEQNPGLRLAISKINFPELTGNEKIILLAGIVTGLLKRISQRNSKEAELLLKNFPRLEKAFSLSVACGERVDGEKQLIADLQLTIPQLAQRLEPTPLQLAEEAGTLLRKMPQKKHMTNRKKWVSGLGLGSNDAIESDGMLVERILAYRHKLSESRVRKILAGASKFSR